MQQFKDNYIIADENTNCSIVIYSVIGDRDEQQDSAGYEFRADKAIAVVCDGMGGFNGGRLASSSSVERMLKWFSETQHFNDISQDLVDEAKKLDAHVRALTNESGEWLKAGSTLAAMFIEKDKIAWIAVGDSRIYSAQEDKFCQITSDHIYSKKLKSQLESGIIKQEEYNKKMSHGEALISFLGIGGLTIIDCNQVNTVSGDRFLIMSDGLYKLVPDNEVFEILSNFANVSDALRALDSKAKHYAKSKRIKRDNMTLALITVK